MDSKYSVGGKSSPNSTVTSLKRKYSYGSQSTVPSKKSNLQSPLKSSTSTTKNVALPSTSSGERVVVKDIQQQRKQLPVYAVRDSYVHLTTQIVIFTSSFPMPLNSTFFHLGS